MQSLDNIALRDNVPPYYLYYDGDAVKNIKDLISSLSAKDALTSNLPVLLSAEQRIFLWMRTHDNYNDPLFWNVVPELKTGDVAEFITTQEDKELEAYDAFTRKLETEKQVEADLTKEATVSDLKITSIRSSVLLEIPGYSLFDVFDGIRISNKILLIVIKYGQRTVIKLNKRYRPEVKEWNEGISILDSNNNESIITIHENQFKLTFEGNTPEQASITRDTVLQSLVIPFQIKGEYTEDLKARFFFETVVMFPYLSDMIMNDKVVSSFLYIKEFQTPQSRKDRYTLFYKSGSSDIYLTLSKDNEVKMSRCRSKEEALLFREKFSKILYYYELHVKTVANIYEKYIDKTI